MAKAQGATVASFEPAGELRIGQVGIANLRVRTLDIDRLAAEMRDRVQRAPKLFARGAVVVDFGGLPALPDVATARALLDALREAGALPVALAWGSSENEQLAIELGLPLLAKFRAQYEPAGGAQAAEAAPAASPAERSRAAEAAPATSGRTGPAPAEAAALARGGEPGLMQASAVRSGQQVYAENRDLTVLAAVGAGAEVIADGSIHIYGALRGRALAGAQGNAKARIFCREFHAELVAIAGHYKVLEDLPADLRGKPVQVWLDGDQLKIAALD
ncbi:putative septum site-determining protein MinC [Luteimonas padinae]|uniref:Probable septum site-determining protein MinC n=1 Tax=Luteimonas padinae TaxID=1714359 RepID=A0ABV6T1G4_9GAMM|nr:septum site-determining protein MinC [Luteimonas padinae]GHD64986.1 putative septum site-determining protein MinC [Luteimonas padinae]